MEKLNNTLLNNLWNKEEIKRKIKKISLDKSRNTTYQNLLNAAKAVLRGKFIVINTYIKN